MQIYAKLFTPVWKLLIVNIYKIFLLSAKLRTHLKVFMLRTNRHFNQLVALDWNSMLLKSKFMDKLVDYSYPCQLFCHSYGCNLPSGLLNRVCRHSIKALVKWRLDTMGLFVGLQIILPLQMCFWCTYNLLDLIYVVFILPWTFEFRGRNSI